MNKDLKIPNHVAIIVDGNGRWAKERGISRIKGHDEGYKNMNKLSKYILKKGIKYLSLYIFSTENFNRPKDEVDHLMDLFVLLGKDKLNDFMKNDIKVVFSGGDDPLPKKVIKARDNLVNATKDNKSGVINFCLNYGGRREIVDATKKIIEDKISINDINEDLFEKYLYNDLPPVDLMIRTSGEQRISNFLLWQLSYAEFYFCNKNFPDFKEKDFDQAIIEYTNRDRRFGSIK